MLYIPRYEMRRRSRYKRVGERSDCVGILRLTPSGFCDSVLLFQLYQPAAPHASHRRILEPLLFLGRPKWSEEYKWGTMSFALRMNAKLVRIHRLKSTPLTETCTDVIIPRASWLLDTFIFLHCNPIRAPITSSQTSFSSWRHHPFIICPAWNTLQWNRLPSQSTIRFAFFQCSSHSDSLFPHRPMCRTLFVATDLHFCILLCSNLSVRPLRQFSASYSHYKSFGFGQRS